MTPTRIRATQASRAGILLLLATLLWPAGTARGDNPEGSGPALPPLPPGWEIFVSTEGRFEVYMPSQPEFTVGSRSTVVGTLEESHYEASLGEAFYLVEVRDMPRVASWVMSDQAIIDRSAESLIEFAKGDNIERTPITEEGHPGVNMVFDAGNRVGFIQRAKILLVERRLFVVIAGAPRKEAKTHMKTFIDSFRFSEK